MDVMLHKFFNVDTNNAFKHFFGNGSINRNKRGIKELLRKPMALRAEDSLIKELKEMKGVNKNKSK